MAKNEYRDTWKLLDLEKTQNVVEEFLLDFEHRLRPKTVKSYRVTYAQFFEYCRVDFDSVSTKLLREWLVFLKDKGYEKGTIKYKLMALKSFFKYCVEEGLILENPTSKIDLSRINRNQDRKTRAIEQKTLKRLLEHAKGKPIEEAMISTLYSTGIRVSELLNIRLEDIDWQNRQILIRRGKGQKDRFVPFTADCEQRLKAYLESMKRTHLFCIPRSNPVSYPWINTLFRRFTQELNLEQPVSPHVLRHTFATFLASKGVPIEIIQELMGHDHISTTQYYIDKNKTELKREYDYYA